MRHSARITTLEAIRVKHRISLFAICVLLLVSRALAQGDAAGGIPPFSTQLGGVYDLVDAASSRILVTVPVRSKNGKIPFPFRLVGNFHATVLCCNQGWGVTSYRQATPLAADLGVYTTSNTNLATRSGTCGSGYYAGFWLVDALGGFHPVNCTGQT